LKETSIDLWTHKLDWIAQNKGMALLDTHPDYMNFNNAKLGDEEYSAGHYEDFLDYVKTKYATQYWNPLPRDMVSFLNEIYG
jgi:hypothetical protein